MVPGYRLDLTYLQRTVCLMMNEAIKATKDGGSNPLGLMDFTDETKLSEIDKKELAKSYILEKMLNPDDNEVEDFVPSLHFLAEDNDKITRKVARNYLTSLNDPDNIWELEENMTKGLDDFSTFVKWPIKRDLDLKRKRMEWVLGFP